MQMKEGNEDKVCKHGWRPDLVVVCLLHDIFFWHNHMNVGIDQTPVTIFKRTATRAAKIRYPVLIFSDLIPVNPCSYFDGNVNGQMRIDIDSSDKHVLEPSYPLDLIQFAA
ncbi:hypothetical protein M8C21_027832 [Ambrosia artemisiifolia]|uniref:Uncharacterized protein n=1 Tax=Ambrosia artemisiifolia TaxID=4212 RepID=A0AAD5GLG9_AMBAR|nr:hypothetical protein M8C21_027832 [Ambrosia artemisiifolia]